MSTLSTFKIYDVEFFGGVTEVVEQAGVELLTSSGGAVKMISLNQRGEFERESFFKNVEGLVTRRDPTSTADVADLGMSMGEVVGVKLNTRIANTAQTLDSFKKIGEDPSLMSFSLGQMYGKSIALDMINSGLVAASTALGAQTGASLDVSAATDGTEVMSYANLVKAMAKMGDQSSRVKTIVMPSKCYFDLVGESLATPITNVGDIAIYEGTVGTMGKTIAVLDSPALIDAVAETFNVLLLTEDAVTINQSEESSIFSETVLGKENVMLRIQGESSFTVTVKGTAWTGTASPTNAALATASNWNYEFADVKSGAGVSLTVK